MSCTLVAARRRGQIGAHLPALRAICAPAAALPLRGDRLRAPARWAGGDFLRLSRCAAGSGLPFRYVAKRWGTGMFLPLRVWCGPILGRGHQLLFLFRCWLAAAARHPGVVASRRGAGGERGMPLYTPLRPPYSPCPGGGRRFYRMSYTLSAARRRGQIGAHLPALRAICAPAAALPLHGDRLRAPARWIGGIFCGSCFGQRGAIFSSRNRLFGSVRRISKGKPYFRRAATAVPTGKDSTAKSFPA